MHYLNHFNNESEDLHASILSSKDATEASFNMLSTAAQSFAKILAHSLLTRNGPEELKSLSEESWSQKAVIKNSYRHACGIFSSELDLRSTADEVDEILRRELAKEFQPTINIGVSIAYHNYRGNQYKKYLGVAGKLGLVGLGALTGIWLG